MMMRMVGVVCLWSAHLAWGQSFPGVEGSDPWAFQPNDPKYSEMWQIFSHVPVDQRAQVDAWTSKHGSGSSVDKAWQLYLGDASTVIAVLDSGIRWHEADLLERHFLNVNELPFPQGHNRHDANGDGRVSISDYKDDARVSDHNKNGVLDPGDLIAAFSNGIDEDGNGYIDDIAGWDFHEMDNDPADRTDFGHGTGEAKDSVATVNNGIGGAGVCGRCSVIFVRLNDSFIVDANAFAKALIYATDIGATVIQQALGSVNVNDYVQHAIDYTVDHDVIIVGSAADEHSYHHNFPSTLDPIIYTNAIRYDALDPRDAMTFSNFNNCSNYGARVDVATSGRSCSSEATGHLSGIVGLARSYAKSLGRTIDVMQMIAMVKNAVDDLDTNGLKDPKKHAMYPGWDMMSGYGRSNAYKLLKAIRDDRIPPSLRVLSPRWFDVLAQPQDHLRVELAVASAAPAKVEAWVYRGIHPLKAHPLKVYESFTNRDQGKHRTYAFSVDRSILLGLAPTSDEASQYRYAVTLVVKATGAHGHVAEQRRTAFVYNDETLQNGFPRKMPGSGESGVLFADLNGDGKDEVVTADGAGWLHAYLQDGRELQGFPVPMFKSRYADKKVVSQGASVFAPLAAADMDGDGRPDIVAVSVEGQVAVVSGTGKMFTNFPYQTESPDFATVSKDQILALGALAAPVIADINGDDKLDIVFVALNGQLYVLGSDGHILPGFPFAVALNGVKAKLTSSPAVGDIDGDGKPEIVFGTNHEGSEAGYIFALSASDVAHAKVAPGFPVRIPMIRDKILPTIGTGIPTTPIIGDIDGDGDIEIVVHAFVGKTYVLTKGGRIKRSLSMQVGASQQSNDDFMLSGFGHPAFAKFGATRALLGVGAGKRILTNMLLGGIRYDFQHLVGAWDAVTGKMLPHWPKPNFDMMLFVSPVAIDLDGDGADEVFASSGGYYIRSYSSTQINDAYTKFTGGWSTAAPAFGDIDGDGSLEMGATTREGFAFVWKLGADKTRVRYTWPMYKGNLRRTGFYKE